MDERAHDADGPEPTLPAEPDPGPDAGPLPRRRPDLRRFGVGAGRTVATLVSIAVLGTMGYGWWTFGDVDEATVTTDVIEPEIANTKVPLDGAVDLLLVGVDSRTDANGNPLPREVLDMLHAGRYEGERNTDTMILVHIPVDGTRAIAISFPRDTWVELAGGFGKHKLNSAFAYAWHDAREELVRTVKDAKELEAQASAIGRKNLIATIEQLIGKAVTIDRYAEVNLASFYEITKAIGGVDVCLNEAVDEPKSGAKFAKGRQVIYGAEALAFVRQRYDLPNGDLDRIVRQQVFMTGMAKKVVSGDMLAPGSDALDNLRAAVQKSVVLDKGWNVLQFAQQMMGFVGGNVSFQTIPVGSLNLETDEDGSAVEVDPGKVRDFVAGLIGGGDDKDKNRPESDDSASDNSKITVNVRNGTNRSGLADSVGTTLADQGFVKGEIGNAEPRSSTVVRYAAGEEAGGNKVATALGGNVLVEEDANLPPGTVTVLLGEDYTDGSSGGADAEADTGDRLTGPAKLSLSGATARLAQPAQPDANGCVN